MDRKSIIDRLVANVKVADEAFETFVKPYEQVLHSMGFKPVLINQGIKQHDVSSWYMGVDASKYDADTISVSITTEKIVIIGGMAGAHDKYEWNYHLKQLPANRLRSTIQSSFWEMEKTIARVARRLLAMAKEIVAIDEVNALNGLRIQTAKRYVNKILAQYSKGMFSDQSWEGVNRVWKAMDDNGINYTMTGAEYQKNESGIPVRKQWKFEVEFWNEKGRMVKIYGIMIASGAGTMDDILSKYDIITYVS
jgi:hypothetical protein